MNVNSFTESRSENFSEFNNCIYTSNVTPEFTESRTEVTVDNKYPSTVELNDFTQSECDDVQEKNKSVLIVEHINDKQIWEKKHEVNPIFSIQNLNVVEHPEHYGAGGSLQCIEAMLIAFGKQATMDFCKLNAFKYIWRAGLKGNEKQDMNKAKRYEEYWKVLNNLPGNEDDGSFHEYLNS